MPSDIILDGPIHRNLNNFRHALTDVLRDIAIDLAPAYQGKLVVKRYEPSTDEMMFGQTPQQYIVEEKRGKKIIGIFPTTERTILVTVNEPYISNNSICVSAGVPREVIDEHLEKYLRNHNIESLFFG